jgi:hypothetical protein
MYRIQRSARRRLRFYWRVAAAEKALRFVSLWHEEIDHSVDSSPCALHGAVCDVLGCNCRVLRDVSRRADRPRFNAAETNGQGDNG